jgi:hypothetical protein
MLRKERTLRQAILSNEKKSSRDKDQTIKDLEEIADLDQNRIIRLNNTIEKCEEKIQMQQRLMSFKEDNQ